MSAELYVPTTGGTVAGVRCLAKLYRKKIYIDICRYSGQVIHVSKRATSPAPTDTQASYCALGTKLRTKDLRDYACLFKAIGDETRLGIFTYLATAADPICACQIEDYVKNLSQPTISHHLRQLREAGLITAERRGTWIYYALDKSVRSRLAEFVALFST